RKGHRGSFLQIHPLKADRHQKGGHLIIGDFSRRKSLYHPVNFLCSQRMTKFFLFNQVIHSHTKYPPLLRRSSFVVGHLNQRSDLRESGAFDFPLNRQRELRAGSTCQKLYFVLAGSLTSKATCARTELSTSLSTDNANCVPTEQAQSTQPAYLSLNTT